MRFITITASVFLIAAPLVSLGTPARADNNDFMGQAKRFLNNGENGGDRDAYERGRSDELRRQQADRDEHRYRRNYDYDQGPNSNSRDSNNGYRAPSRGYSNYDR